MVRSIACLIVLILTCLAFSLTSPIYSVAQDVPTPTPVEQPQSLFTGDPCAPPCWFGLVAGESTSADVEQMMVEFDDVFFRGLDEPDDNQLDPVTGYIVEGGYYIYSEKTYLRVPTRNVIRIDNSIISYFRVWRNQDLRLRDVLRLLGQPDIMYFNDPQITEFDLILIYTKWHIFVYMSERPGTERCSIGSIRIHFQFDYAEYLSLTQFERLVEELPSVMSYLREVPSDVWQDWLDGKVGDYCSDAWEQLPQPEVTPAAEVTLEPAATQQP